MFRLAQLITANTRQVLSLEIAEDMKKFLSEIADEIRVHPLSFAEYYSAVGGDKNEAYYELLKTGQMMVDGIPVLSPTCLIPFKAKAWLDLKERKLNGERAI